MVRLLHVMASLAAAVSAAPSRAARFVEENATLSPTHHPHTSSLATRNESPVPPPLGWECVTNSTPVDGVEWTTSTTDRGVLLTNADSETRNFYFYQNSCDAVPYSHISLAPGVSRFVSFSVPFEGRITRGTDQFNLVGRPQLLGTWVEFNIQATGLAWGDVSLIRGCDGAATIRSLDGTGLQRGFEEWILDGAPQQAYDMKESGVSVIRAIGELDKLEEVIARDYVAARLGYGRVYIDNAHDNPVISSGNGQFGVVFFPGRP